MQVLPFLDQTTDNSAASQALWNAATKSSSFSALLSQGLDERGAQRQAEAAQASWQGTQTQSVSSISDDISQASRMPAASLAEIAAAAERIMAGAQDQANQAAAAAEPVMGASSVNSVSSSTHGISGSDSMRARRMTTEDVAGLKDTLKKYGFSDADLDKISQQAATASGLTWGQFVSFLSQRVSGAEKSVDISPDQQQRIQSFMQKLGLTPQQSEKLTNSLAAGKSQAVLQTVQQALRQLPQDSKASFTTDELVSLGKALGMSDSSLVKLNDLMAKSGTADGIPLKSMGTVVALMQQDVQARNKISLDAAKDLRSSIEDAMRAARENAKRTKSADNHEDTTAKDMLLAAQADKKDGGDSSLFQTKAQAANGTNASRQPQGQGTATGTSASGAIGQEEQAQAGLRFQDVKDAKDDRETEKGAAGTKSGERKDGAQQQAASKTKVALSQKTDADAGGKGGSFSSSEEEEKSAWNEFFGKIGLAGNAEGRAQSQGTGFALGNVATAQANVQSAGQGLDKATAQDVLRQVQSGILTNLGQGTKQLSLELTPENLGKMNVVLQVNNKEVKAIIKADNEEVSQTLNAQLAQIKESLEQQGLKVVKIEVQTGVSQNEYGSQWQQGTNRERQASQEESLARMMRGRQGGTGGDNVAQVMQETGSQAIVSQTGIDVFA